MNIKNKKFKNMIDLNVKNTDFLQVSEFFLNDLEINFKKHKKWYEGIINKNNDYLNKKNYIFEPQDITKQSPLTILHAPWGMGKTFFIENFAKLLIDKKIKSNIFKKIIIIDAWKFAVSKNIPFEFMFNLANKLFPVSKFWETKKILIKNFWETKKFLTIKFWIKLFWKTIKEFWKTIKFIWKHFCRIIKQFWKTKKILIIKFWKTKKILIIKFWKTKKILLFWEIIKILLFWEIIKFIWKLIWKLIWEIIKILLFWEIIKFCKKKYPKTNKSKIKKFIKSIFENINISINFSLLFFQLSILKNFKKSKLSKEIFEENKNPTIIFIDNFERLGSNSWDLLKSILQFQKHKNYLIVLLMDLSKLKGNENNQVQTEYPIQKYVNYIYNFKQDYLNFFLNKGFNNIISEKMNQIFNFPIENKKLNIREIEKLFEHYEIDFEQNDCDILKIIYKKIWSEKLIFQKIIENEIIPNFYMVKPKNDLLFKNLDKIQEIMLYYKQKTLNKIQNNTQESYNIDNNIRDINNKFFQKIKNKNPLSHSEIIELKNLSSSIFNAIFEK